MPSRQPGSPHTAREAHQPTDPHPATTPARTPTSAVRRRRDSWTAHRRRRRTSPSQPRAKAGQGNAHRQPCSPSQRPTEAQEPRPAAETIHRQHPAGGRHHAAENQQPQRHAKRRQSRRRRKPYKDTRHAQPRHRSATTPDRRPAARPRQPPQVPTSAHHHRRSQPRRPPRRPPRPPTNYKKSL